MSPRYPLEGVVSWNMNTTCNYRCNYCTQRFVDDRKTWARDLPRFVEAFTALPGDWEVKLSGGEPFRHPGFLDAVRGLVEGGVRVSVVTNLSSSNEVLDEYVAIVNARPGVFSASLHLEYAAPDEFFARLRRVESAFAGSVNATLVATRENMDRVDELRAIWPQLKVQPEKQDRDVVAYSAQDRARLQAWGGHNGTGWIDPDFSGRDCWAGARYFIVDHRGDAYRCYPARRRKSESVGMHALGNVLDGSFRLGMKAAPCAYSYCNCTVPQARGMVDTSRRV
ncbi:MAG: radical SAM protein [Proteobacteria bacterium]|nr:radical SAM protein [Pseudomonadota bacterium]MCP4915639.1 radical SAM protein [Pseudomonadota bacterium]